MFRSALGANKNKSRNSRDKFLYYYFFGAEWRKTIFTWEDSGRTVERLHIIDFPRFEIRLPPLPIQRKIADVLSSYDDLIEVNVRRIHVLETMAQSVYREWFGKVDMKKPLPKRVETKTFW